MPTINVALLPNLLPEGWEENCRAAIVIDTLRFTTTACTALAAGASSVNVTSDIESARQLAAAASPSPLLCGERKCGKIEGFDLGNSPLEYTPQRIRDQQLLFTTTNGTRAVAAAAAARQILLGSLANRQAVVNYTTELSIAPEGTLWIVCSGTDRKIAVEDTLTAGAIIDAFEKTNADQEATSNWQISGDAALLAKTLWLTHSSISQREQLCHAALGGAQLLRNGYTQDVAYCMQLDHVTAVPTNSVQDKTTFQLG